MIGEIPVEKNLKQKINANYGDEELAFAVDSSFSIFYFTFRVSCGIVNKPFSWNTD